MTTYLMERLRDYAYDRCDNPEAEFKSISRQAADVIEILTERIEENNVLLIATRVRIEELEAALYDIIAAVNNPLIHKIARKALTPEFPT